MTTLNLIVGADGDDGQVTGSGGYTPGGSGMYVGHFSSEEAIWARFLGPASLSGAVINSATYWLNGISGGFGTALTKVRAEYAASPAAPTSNADYFARTPTTAGIDWDVQLVNNVYDDLDITTVIQELADNFNPTAIQILHRNDGGSSADTQAVQWGGNPVRAPKLDIDFTEAIIPFDAATSHEHTGNTTFSHACSGLQRVLYVMCAVRGNFLTSKPTAITYNGVALTELLVVDHPNSSGHIAVWRLANPASGSNTVSITVPTADGVESAAISYNGVNQNDPDGSVAGATSESGDTQEVVSSATGKRVLMAVMTLADTYTPGTGTIERVDAEYTGATSCQLLVGDEEGASSVTIGWTENVWGYAAVTLSINPYVPEIPAASIGPGIVIGSATAFIGEGAIGAPDLAAGQPFIKRWGGIRDAAMNTPRRGRVHRW